MGNDSLDTDTTTSVGRSEQTTPADLTGIGEVYGAIAFGRNKFAIKSELYKIQNVHVL